jgi:hypothetical protein
MRVGDEDELEDGPSVPSTPIPDRYWIPASELAELWQLPADPDFMRDLEKMGGDMIDPWT